jgi:hypothetical protein
MNIFFIKLYYCFIQIIDRISLLICKDFISSASRDILIEGYDLRVIQPEINNIFSCCLFGLDLGMGFTRLGWSILNIFFIFQYVLKEFLQ